MAVPKRRTSKSKKLKRRTHQKLAIPNFCDCSYWKKKKKSHHVCSSCGHYDGKEVVEA